MDTRALRNCFGRFATGVTVVTCRTDAGNHGITVNSFTSVSLEPPLVLVAIDNRARACGYLEGRSFAVNILAAGQKDLALHFAGRPQENLTVPWEEGGRAPRLAGALAWIECSPWQACAGGDHVLYLGKVEEFWYGSGDALLFYCGQFQSVPVMGGTR